MDVSRIIRGMIFGRRIAQRLLQENPDSEIIFTSQSIGDQCMALCYAGQYRRAANISELVYVTTKVTAEVTGYFTSQVDRVIALTDDEHRALFGFFKTSAGRAFQDSHQRLKCVYYTSYVRNDVFFRNKFFSLSDVQKAIYHLPRESTPCAIDSKPAPEWLNKLEQRGVIVKGATVIVCPHANSITQTPLTFFQQAANILNEHGFTVLTSVHGRQSCLEGSYPIDFGLGQSVELADSCGYVLGARSGLLDLMAFSSAKIIAIDNDEYPYCGACDLTIWWPQNKGILTLRYGGANLIEQLEECIIKEWLNA